MSGIHGMEDASKELGISRKQLSMLINSLPEEKRPKKGKTEKGGYGVRWDGRDHLLSWYNSVLDPKAATSSAGLRHLLPPQKPVSDKHLKAEVIIEDQLEVDGTTTIVDEPSIRTDDDDRLQEGEEGEILLELEPDVDEMADTVWTVISRSEHMSDKTESEFLNEILRERLKELTDEVEVLVKKIFRKYDHSDKKAVR